MWTFPHRLIFSYNIINMSSCELNIDAHAIIATLFYTRIGHSIYRQNIITAVAAFVLVLAAMIIIEKTLEFTGALLLWEYYFIKSFFTSILNWLEVPLSVCAIIFVSVIGRRCQCPYAWQWEVGVVAVFLVWFDLIFIMRKFLIFDVGKIKRLAMPVGAMTARFLVALIIILHYL